MPIGTSDGKYFDDELAQAVQNVPVEVNYQNASEPFPAERGTVAKTLDAIATKGIPKYIDQTIKGTSDLLMAPGEASKGNLTPDQITEQGVGLAFLVGGTTYPLANFKPGLGMFGGRFSKSAVVAAESLEKHGVSSNAIKVLTGLERGNDYKWRAEFSDKESKFTPEGFKHLPEVGDNTHAAILSEVLDHPALYERYPEAKVIPVIRLNSRKDLNGDLGEYSPKDKTITITNDQTPAEIHNTLLHEIQHFIQDIEGFNLNIPQEVPKDIEQMVARAYMDGPGKATLNEMQRAIDRGDWIEASQINKDMIADAKRYVYTTLSSEVEARNTERRLMLGEDARRLSLGAQTEDIPRYEQVIVNRGKSSSDLKQSGVWVPAGSSYNPEDRADIGKLPKDWSSFSIVKDSIGGEIATSNPEKIEGNPKYNQDLTNPRTQISKEVIADRVERLGRMYNKVLEGNQVTTEEMVDALNGFLDILQGLEVIKGFLGMQNSTPAGKGNKAYLMKPGET